MAMPTYEEVVAGGGLASGCLTVRDYFAAAALQGRRADPSLDLSPIDAARAAYADADAMLAERDK